MAHIHEKIDFTVGVFIVHDGKVLLRFHDKYHLLYFAKAKNAEVKPAEGEQQDSWARCSREDLKTMDLRPDVRHYAELALDTLGK